MVDGRKLTIRQKIHDQLFSVSNRATVTMKLQTFQNIFHKAIFKRQSICRQHTNANYSAKLQLLKRFHEGAFPWLKRKNTFPLKQNEDDTSVKCCILSIKFAGLWMASNNNEINTNVSLVFVLFTQCFLLWVFLNIIVPICTPNYCIILCRSLFTTALRFPASKNSTRHYWTGYAFER